MLIMLQFHSSSTKFMQIRYTKIIHILIKTEKWHSERSTSAVEREFKFPVTFSIWCFYFYNFQYEKNNEWDHGKSDFECSTAEKNVAIRPSFR